MNSTIN